MEDGVTQEDPLLFREGVVHPEVGLILIVGFGAGLNEIARSGEVRQWVVCENLASQVIPLSHRNGVVHERRTWVGRRIEDLLRENPLPLKECGNHAESWNAGP